MIKQMVEDGFSVRKIAQVTGKSEKEIKDFGYSLKLELFSEDKIDHIMDLYRQGVSAKKLGAKYSIDKRRIHKWANSRGYLRTLEESHRLTYFNEHKMDEIDTTEKAYWLGFFYADAYNGDLVNTFNVTLKGSDIEHLRKLAKFFELPVEKVFRHTTNSGIDTSNIKLYSKYLCGKMTKLGCPRAKSLIVTYPTWLDESLHSSFIRGLFDGDGCLTYRKKQKEWKWSLAGTYEICDKVCEILKKEVGIERVPYCISKNGKNTYAIEVAGNQQILRLCNWLYDGSVEDSRLDRKYESFRILRGNCEFH